MVKKDRVTSAVNFGDKAALREMGTVNNKYGSQEAIYPPGHISDIR